MKNSFLFPCSLSVIVLCFSGLARISFAEELNFQPVEPGVLLGLLPKPPDNWKLVVSMGANQSGDQPVLTSVAQRVYRLPPSAPDPGAAELPAKTTEISLLDVANDMARFTAFKDFSEQPAAGDSSGGRRFFSGGIPVIEKVKGSRRTFLVGFSPRLLLVLKFENQDQKEAEAWLSRVNLASIQALADRIPQRKFTTGMVTVRSINELDPRMNTSSQMAYQTRAEREDDLKKHQATLPTNQP
jgi:hypothetical protein